MTWICEWVLHMHLILATFKHKFIYDQAINPKISLVLSASRGTIFQSCRSNTSQVIYIDIYIYILEVKKSDVHTTSLQIQSHNLWQNRISDIKPRSCDSNHIKKLSIPFDAIIFFSIITKLENTV